MADITVQLLGHFRIASQSGENLTPQSQKAQGVLALLATGKGCQRSRMWLQDKLWSDSDPEKSSANLRQSLTTIRRALGEHADLLQANRLSVWLDESRLEIDWHPDMAVDAVSGENAGFLEGLDIADPEFSDWLQMMRSAGGGNGAVAALPAATQAASRATAPWRVALLTSEDSFSTAFHLENEFISLLARNISESSNIEITFEPLVDPDGQALEVRAKATALNDGNIGLRVFAQHAKTRRAFWSETAVSSGASGPIEKSFDLLGLSFRLLSALAREINLDSPAGSSEVPSSFLLGTVLPSVFSFRPEKLDQADELLGHVEDERLSATALGWRAQIAVVRLIERFSGDVDEYIGMGKMLAAKAIESDAMNSMALATAANANVLLDWDFTAGAELSSLAIRVNPSNPFVWWAYSNAALYAGDAGKALEAAKVARQLSAKSPMQFWCEFQIGLAAISAGDIDQAARALETSSALSPQFRPPRRYLLAIYSHRGEVERAERMIRELKALEPDFTVEAFAADPDYPVSLARNSGLINQEFFKRFMSPL